MARVRILTDSTADVPPDLVARLNITVVPAYIQMAGQSLRDGEQISRAEFYFYEQVRALYSHLEIPVSEVGPVVGCHIGPAALGVAGILASG